MKKDFVTEIVGLVQEIAEVDGQKLASIEHSIRMRYGGERVNIRPTPPIDLDQAMVVIDQQLGQRKSVREIAQNTGVCRATIYRWMAKSRKTRRNCATN